jgi:2-dehydro-3-deoxyphosphooctonate aldolase (KDO 8-P synthase)
VSKAVTVGSGSAAVTFSNDAPLALIAGPCVIESEEHAIWIAQQIRAYVGAYVFKASFDKANRSSVHSYRGPGLKDGLRILREVRNLGIPVLTDIHETAQAEAAGGQVDVLQIPAFLCRQTDLLVAAGRTGCAVNIKKGQFVSPGEFRNAAEKVASAGNEKIILTERGSSFGYNNLIVDMRGLAIMTGSGYPVVFDATHSVQLPGAAGSTSGGQPEFIAPLSRAATAVGIAGLFVEVHENPARALSDGANALKLDLLPQMYAGLRRIDRAVKQVEGEDFE